MENQSANHLEPIRQKASPWLIAGLAMALSPILTVAQTNYVQLKSFGDPGLGGSLPSALLLASDGALYGTAGSASPANAGIVIKISQTGDRAVTLHSFVISVDGHTPQSELTELADGMLYGTTAYGGTTSGLGFGTVFRLNKDGSGYEVLHRFGIKSGDGKYPSAGLAVCDGTLFGTTYNGGVQDNGTLFRINPDGSGYVVMRSFTGGAAEAGPHTRLVKATNGALYGMLLYAGSNNFSGAVFKIDPNGAGYTVVHRLAATGAEGTCPSAGLIEGSDGRLYGTTRSGGTGENGVVFKLEKDGAGFSVLRRFSGQGGDGASPNRLVEGPDGILYGTTSAGGRYSGGTVFKLNKDGNGYVVLRSFARAQGDGREPESSLTLVSNLALYGTTASGGANNLGTIYALFTQPHSWFTASSIGQNHLVTLNAFGAAGTSYRLQVSRDSALANWIDVSTNIANVYGTLAMTNLPGNGPQSYYRLVTP